MATVKIPAINVNLPIYHGTESATLDKGIGHLFGTALPVGGESTHTVLTGHTGLGTATMFDQLTSLKEGDVFYIEVPGRHLKYQINDIRVVLPNETETLNKVAGKDLATLITCTPYGVNTHRLLVTGERVPMDEETVAAESAQVKGTVLRPWMIAILIAVAIILLVSAIVWARSRKRRTEEPAQIDEAVASGCCFGWWGCLYGRRARPADLRRPDHRRRDRRGAHRGPAQDTGGTRPRIRDCLLSQGRSGGPEGHMTHSSTQRGTLLSRRPTGRARCVSARV